jgi:hypothetical protein
MKWMSESIYFDINKIPKNVRIQLPLFKYGNPDRLFTPTSNPYGRAMGVPFFGLILLKK